MFNSVADPLKYITVDAQEIKYRDLRLFKIQEKRTTKLLEFGRIVGGDWDVHSVQEPPIELPFICKAIHQRIHHRLPWEETGIIARKMLQLPIDGCRTVDDLFERYRIVDRAIAQIRREGRLRRQSEVDGGTLENEVFVSIGRNGELFLAIGGTHRVAIAKALNLPIDVLVLCRHEEWQRIRERGERRDHPDMGDI